MSLLINWIARSLFLLHRDAGYRRALAQWEAKGKPGNWLIITPPENEILCDLCNAEVSEDEVPVLMDPEGQILAAICDSCVVAHDVIEAPKENRK